MIGLQRGGGGSFGPNPATATKADSMTRVASFAAEESRRTARAFYESLAPAGQTCCLTYGLTDAASGLPFA